jgi:hypothetical protein
VKAEVKAEWVAALRSGEYKQGKGYLAQIADNGETVYCCLGVLSDLAVKAGVIECKSAGDQYIQEVGEVLAFDEYTGFLSPAVVEWAGTESESPHLIADPVGGMDSDASLAGLNDAGVSFKTIADLIEAQL